MRLCMERLAVYSAWRTCCTPTTMGISDNTRNKHLVHTHLARDQYQPWRKTTIQHLLGRLVYIHKSLQHEVALYENRIAPVVGSVNVNSGACEMMRANSAILREQTWSASCGGKNTVTRLGNKEHAVSPHHRWSVMTRTGRTSGTQTYIPKTCSIL